MSLKTINLLDRIHGCLLGIAAGDALGMPALSTLERTIAMHGVNGFPPLYNSQVEAANNFGLRQLSEQFLAATKRINSV